MSKMVLQKSPVFVTFVLTAFAQTTCLPWINNNLLMASSTMQLNEADMALSHSVTVGAYSAVYECARQFKYDRWNCPASAFFLNGTTPLPVQASAEINRETALVRAMTSAGIAFTLTKNCSAGDFANCICDTRFSRRQAGFEWGGCSDNFHFGSMVATQFLDSQESGANPASLVNLHNNAAGRIAVKKTMRRMCKCHGVSGSCATQTCWRQISDFKTVGEYLKKGYRKGKKVRYASGFLVEEGSTRNIQKRHQRSRNQLNNNRSNFMNYHRGKKSARDRRQLNKAQRQLSKNRIRLSGARSENRIARQRRGGRSSNKLSESTSENESNKLKKRFIVFLEDSPDYCQPNALTGSPGVLGRKCSTEPGKNSKDAAKKCAKLCRSCGLKPKREVVSVWTSCNCRFKWCCDVACDTCKRKKIEITCVAP